MLIKFLVCFVICIIIIYIFTTINLKTIIMKTIIKHLETTISKLHVKHTLAINEGGFHGLKAKSIRQSMLEIKNEIQRIKWLTSNNK